MNWEEKYRAVSELVDGYRRERDEALERVRLLEAEVERVNAREDATRRELSETRIDMRDMERERDEARAETARLRRLLNMAEDELIAADDHGRREAKRADNVEAEVEALKAECDEARAKLYEMNLKLNQAYTDAERLQKERDAAIARITEVGVMVARGLGDMEKYAYKRGAEAMRKACARWMSEREGISQWVYDDALSALPIPEEP